MEAGVHSSADFARVLGIPMNISSRSALRCLFTATVLGLASTQAQTVPPPTPPAAPRLARPGPVVSPELKSDGSVTFRLRAPKATEVKVSGQFGP